VSLRTGSSLISFGSLGSLGSPGCTVAYWRVHCWTLATVDGLIEGWCDERRDREADWALRRDSLARLPPDRRQDVIVGGQEGTRDAEQSKGTIVPSP